MASTNCNNRIEKFANSRAVRPLAEVDNLLDHFFGTNVQGPNYRAPASVWETEEQLHLELDAPGVAQDGVELTFEKGQLSVTLERTSDEDRKYWHNERQFGKVTRTLTLPDTVDPESLEAQLNAGVLHISVAKKPETQPRKIEVQVG